MQVSAIRSQAGMAVATSMQASAAAVPVIGGRISRAEASRRVAAASCSWRQCSRAGDDSLHPRREVPNAVGVVDAARVSMIGV